MQPPIYSQRRIRHVESLAKALGKTPGFLRAIAERAPSLYIGPKEKPKKNGMGVRYVYDTKAPLKPLLQQINSTILRKVSFPIFLTGSISGRDYVANVSVHAGARIVISEDISAFFDCISSDQVYGIWHRFFGFSDEVARILTALTTKNGRVFQGTPTSSYLANLAFWDIEHTVAAKLSSRGIRYSRYVDDITMSSIQHLSKADMDWAIAQIYAMMGSRGFRPKRTKHTVQTSGDQIIVMGLVANRRATVTPHERSNTRAQVRCLERKSAGHSGLEEINVLLSKTAARVGRLRRLHPTEGVQLRTRLAATRERLNSLKARD